VLFAVCLFVLAWSALLVTYQESIYTLLIAAFLVGAALLIPPLMTTVLFLAGLAVYVGASLLRFGVLFTHGTVAAIEIVGVLSVAWLVSFLIYRQHVQTIGAESRLEALAAVQVEEIRNRTADLNARLKEREVLLREIHHRVKNNLQILASLLRLTGSFPSQGGPGKLLQAAEQRILSMALVHQQLYDTDHLEEVDLAEYLENLSNYVVQAYQEEGEVRMERSLSPHTVPIDIAVNLGLIVTEALSNSLLHAFSADQRDRRIALSLVGVNGQITIEIRDNGRGIGSDAMNTSSPHGLGLILIDSLTSQLHGSFNFTSSNGTTFVCTAPVE
jgi:two-component sensor histidine kinase